MTFMNDQNYLNLTSQFSTVISCVIVFFYDGSVKLYQMPLVARDASKLLMEILILSWYKVALA